MTSKRDFWVVFAADGFWRGTAPDESSAQQIMLHGDYVVRYVPESVKADLTARLHRLADSWLNGATVRRNEAETSHETYTAEVREELANELLAELDAKPAPAKFVPGHLVHAWRRYQRRDISQAEFEGIVAELCETPGQGMERAVAKQNALTAKPEPTKAEREALFRFLLDAIKDTHDDVGFDKDYTDFNRGQRNAFARVQVWLLRDKLDTSLPAPPDSEAKLKGWDESPGPFSPGEFLANKPDSEGE